jgi:aminoglycoside phosphotransferase (APT) family kinase protein
MHSQIYTDREWAFLTHYHEYDWPETWSTLREDRLHWLDIAERICNRHQMTMRNESTLARGSNVAVVMDDAVVKIFARHNPVWFAREAEALEVVQDIEGVKTPRLLAQGEIEDGEVRYNYMVMERLPGEPFLTQWKSMASDDRESILRQVAQMARAIHSVSINGLKSFGQSPQQEWVARMRGRGALCMEYFRDDLPDNLFKQLPDLLEGYMNALTDDFQPRLLHADIIGGNIMVEQQGGAWKAAGIIDFGDVEVGPLEYEWVAICHKAARSQPFLINAFFDEYGIPDPRQGESLQRLKLYSLLHRFPVLSYTHEDHPEEKSLDRLIERLWGIESVELGK